MHLSKNIFIVFFTLIIFFPLTYASCNITVSPDGNIDNAKNLSNKSGDGVLDIWQQPLISDPQELIKILSTIDLKSYTILDTNPALGIVANAILSQKVKRLIVTKIDHNIFCHNSKNVTILSGDFKKFKLQGIKRKTFGIISQPSVSSLSDLRGFIDNNNIENAILIIPVWSYNTIFSDFRIVGAINNDKFYPAKNNLHLIVQKGFDDSHKLNLQPNQIAIAGKLISLPQLKNILQQKFDISDTICEQAGDHLSGRSFNDIGEAVQILKEKEKNQQGDLIHYILHADWEEQQKLIKKYKLLLTKSDIKLLEEYSSHSTFSYSFWLGMERILRFKNIVIGQRAEIENMLKKNAITLDEILNVPSALWNWHINLLWVKASIGLKKDFFIIVENPRGLLDILLHSKTGKDFLITAKKNNNYYAYHSKFRRPTYLGREIALLIDAGYLFSLDIKNGYFVIKATTSSKA